MVKKNHKGIVCETLDRRERERERDRKNFTAHINDAIVLKSFRWLCVGQWPEERAT